MNLTLKADPEIVKKVRRIALERDTTLSEMVRQFLSDVAHSVIDTREAALAALDQSFSEFSRDMGVRTWTRDSLHER